MVTTSGIRAGRAFVEIFVENSRLIRGLRSAQARLRAFSRSVQAMGRQLLTVGTSAALPFALASRTFANFEAQMARVKALTGASEEDFARLEQAAKKLGATTVFSASQAAEAMSYFALAGFDVDNILGAIGPTLDLAAAGQIEIAEAADIAAKIMAGMGLSADDLGNAVDVMAKAMTTANTDLTMLGEAFKYVGPMAKTAGISLEEITAAIQLLSNAGIQGEMAGSTLRGMLLSLTSPSAEAQKELDRLGVKVVDEAGNVRSLTGIIADLEGALASAGSGEKLRVLGTIFPARQAAGAAELVSQGADRLREATEALGDSSGTASRIAGTQLDTLKGDVTILLSSLEGVAIAIGEAFSTELRSAVRGVTSFLSALSTWIGENRQVVLTTVAIIAGVLAAGAAMVGLGGAVSILAWGFGGIVTAVALVASLLSAMLNPVGLVIAAIVGLGGYLIATSGIGSQALAWLGERFQALKATVLTAFQGIGDAIAGGDLSLAARIVWLTLKMEWQKGINWLEARWLDFKGFFVGVFQSAVFAVARFLNDAWSGLQVAWIETTAFLSDAWVVFIGVLQRGWHRFAGFFKKVWARVKAVFTDSDAELEIQQINAEIAAQDRAVEQRQNSQLIESDRQRQSRLSQVEQQRVAVAGELDSMQLQEQQERERRHRAALETSEAKLAEARREWDAAIQEAAQKRAAAEAIDTAEPPDLMGQYQQQLEALGEMGGGLDEIDRRSIGVQGAFNAAAIRGLGAGGAADRTATAVEAMDKKLGMLVREAQHGGLVFA